MRSVGYHTKLDAGLGEVHDLLLGDAGGNMLRGQDVWFASIPSQHHVDWWPVREAG